MQIIEVMMVEKKEMKGGNMVMNYSSRTATTPDSTEAEMTEKTVATGSSAEALAGGAALVLAIIGLAGMMPMTMSAIGVIAAGAAFLFQGAAVAARHSYLQRMVSEEHAEGELMTGTSAEILGGIAGIVLGILALLGVVPQTLLAVSAITFGGTLLFGSSAVYRVSTAAMVRSLITRERAAGAAGAQSLVGIGSATLGIVALVGIASQTLVLVAVLAVGAAALLGGGSLTTRMVGLLYR
jgi:hypothetical protein